MSKVTATDFVSIQDSVVANLVEHAALEKATGHATFSAKEFKLPEGITEESISSHAQLFNNITAGVEVATAQMAVTAHADNKDMTTLDGSLNIGGVAFTSQHHLKQTIGEEAMYGVSTSAMDMVYSDEQTDWLTKAREVNKATAQGLFDI